MADIIDIEIMEDGVIKIKTQGISDAKHLDADALLDEICEMAGGERKTEKNEHEFFKNKRVLRGGRIVKAKSSGRL